MWYSDGVEGEVIQDLLDRFEAENPEIDVILDNVAYQVIQEQLPIQLASGQGPTSPRVTNLKEQAQHWLDLRPYLSDPAYWEENFGDRLDWMREDGSDAIPASSRSSPSRRLRQPDPLRAGGRALPGADATWDEWIEASRQVMESQGLPAAFAIDRSGHRISGPNVSFGATTSARTGCPRPSTRARWSSPASSWSGRKRA
jgi:alpha-1,4-digalacturonate transport system substrate-binding protein